MRQCQHNIISTILGIMMYISKTWYQLKNKFNLLLFVTVIISEHLTNYYPHINFHTLLLY